MRTLVVSPYLRPQDSEGVRIARPQEPLLGNRFALIVVDADLTPEELPHLNTRLAPGGQVVGKGA
jgi:hypothetical protein